MIAGVDECGRGCLFGEVTASAVVLPSPESLSTADQAMYNQLTDSKKISAKKREKLAPFIRRIAIAHAIGSASVAEVDEINILQATMRAMHRALESVAAQLSQAGAQLSEIRVDGTYFKSFRDIPHKTIIGGDLKEKAISAASILAKTHRDALMVSLATEDPALHAYQIAKNMGYGTAAHMRALKEHGVTPHHRMSYAPVAAAAAAAAAQAKLLLPEESQKE